MNKLWASNSKTHRAIVLFVLSTMGFALSHVLIRLISNQISPIQIAFFHNLIGLIILLPWLAKIGFGHMRTQHFPMHFLRAVLNITAMLTFFVALSMIPLAKVTALFFTSPIFATILSIVLLGERAKLRRWTAVICGFIGTLVILRPGIQEIDAGSILVLISALSWAGSVIVIKVLGRTETSMTTTGYMSFLMMLLSAPPAILVWQTPSPAIWPYLIAIAILGTSSILAVTQALREAEASSLVPYDFLKLVWVSILGYILFTQEPDIFTWTGAAIVFASTFYLTYRENKLARQTQ